MFFAKERKYSCTRIKIANILAIVALIYARSNKRLFYERVFGVHNYAFHINELSSYIDREVYYETEYMDDNKPITSTELKLDAKVPERYQDISGLKPEYQKVIQEVFFRFGAYKGSYFRKLIEPLFENANICDVNGIIILEKVFLLKEDDFKSCTTNREFIDYLLSFPKE